MKGPMVTPGYLRQDELTRAAFDEDGFYKALEAATPVLQDAVVAGHDREWVGLLAWINVPACRELCAKPEADVETLVRASEVVERVREGLKRHNAVNPGSSTRVERVLLMTEPASIDANEVTDKGYINQRATLDNRAELVEHLYVENLYVETARRDGGGRDPVLVIE